MSYNFIKATKKVALIIIFNRKSSVIQIYTKKYFIPLFSKNIPTILILCNTKDYFIF